MENLPQEIIYIIYKYLSLNQIKSRIKKDYLNFSMTSKYIRKCLFDLDMGSFLKVFGREKRLTLKHIDENTDYYLRLWKYYFFEISYNNYIHISPHLDNYIILDCKNLGSLKPHKYIGNVLKVELSNTTLPEEDLIVVNKTDDYKLENCILEDYSIFKNATRLELQGSDITDLSYFTKVIKLNLSMCKEINYDSLKYLKNLRSLDLSNTDIEDLKYICDVKELNLRGCRKIKNFKLLGSQVYLDLSFTSIKNVSHLGNVKNLNLSLNNLNSVEGLTNVIDLDISFNSEINDFSSLINIRKLDCRYTKTSFDFKKLKTLEFIKY